MGLSEKQKEKILAKGLKGLFKALKDSDEEVREYSAEQIEKFIGSFPGTFEKSEVKMLYKLLRSSDENVRELALKTLEKLVDGRPDLFDESSIKPLNELLYDPNLCVIIYAAKTIGTLADNDIYDESSIESLNMLITHYNDKVRESAGLATRKAMRVRRFHESTIMHNAPLGKES